MISTNQRLFPKIWRQSCPCCQSQDFAAVYQGHDDRLGYPDTFTVALCRVCNYRFLQDPIDVEMLGALYEHYYPNYPFGNRTPSRMRGLRTKLESARWFQVLEGSPDISVFIKPGESVLDVGCGYGASAEIAAQRGATWAGVEIDPKCCEHLQSRGMAFYCGNLEQYAKVAGRDFDTILFSQVLEHLYEPISTLRAARKLLRRGGRILISAPNGDSRYRQQYGPLWLHWHVPYHVGHWNRRSLSFACGQAGLRVHRFATTTFFAWWRVQRFLKAVPLGEPNPSYPGGALPSWARRSGLAVLYHLFVDLYLRVADKRGDGDLIIAELHPISAHQSGKEDVIPVVQ